MLQQALDREDVPAEAEMREDLAEKLRQVEARLQARRKQAGPGPEAGPRPTTPTCTAPTCTTPTCGAAESMAAEAGAEASAAAGPGGHASGEQAPVARLLLELSDDLLLVCAACAPHVHSTHTARAPRVHRVYTACAPHLCTTGDPMPAGRG